MIHNFITQFSKRGVLLATITCLLIAVTVVVGKPRFKDSDKDGISDQLEKLSGLNPKKEECNPTASSCYKNTIEAVGAGGYYIVILDQSGSMQSRMGDKSRMELAKGIVADYVKDLPSSVKLGFFTYGFRGCTALKEEQSPFTRLNKKRLLGKIKKLRPRGLTPIGKSISMLRKKLKGRSGVFNILLVSDGLESCRSNPVEEAKRLITLNSAKTKINLYVVGVGVTSHQAGKLKQISDAAGGQFLRATDEESFRKVFLTPMEGIMTSYKNMICLQNDLDRIISCHQRRLGKIELGYIKLKMSKLDESQKEAILKRKPLIAKASEKKIQKVRKKRARLQALQDKKITSLSKFLSKMKQKNSK